MQATDKMIKAAYEHKLMQKFGIRWGEIREILNAALATIPDNLIDGDNILIAIAQKIDTLNQKATDCKRSGKSMAASLHSAQRDVFELIAVDIKSGKYDYRPGE